MTRVGKAAMLLSRDLGGLQVGDQIPTMQDLASRYGYGKGTIQAALGVLAEVDALRVETHGHLGTYVTKIDKAALWDISGRGTFVIAMPLPYTLRYEALATGFHAAFEDAGVPLSLPYVRGAYERINLLRDERIDLAVMSKMASSENPHLEVIRDFGSGTYVGSHQIMMKNGRDIQDPHLRVAVDPSSPDQIFLARKAFPRLRDDMVVETTYNQLSRGFEGDLFDATIWNADEARSKLPSDVVIVPMPELEGIGNTNAVLVKWDSSDAIGDDVLKVLGSEDIISVVRAVMAHQTMPRY
ncbi:YhfZ family protein [Cutibacterium sp. V970]|uniref:YhfZ family protein n=1 Tax=Cutibacterium sp. V970 TaxID=3446481 RepID=UPI003EE19488